jgi:hypothetical protein
MSSEKLRGLDWFSHWTNRQFGNLKDCLLLWIQEVLQGRTWTAGSVDKT